MHIYFISRCAKIKEENKNEKSVKMPIGYNCNADNLIQL